MKGFVPTPPGLVDAMVAKLFRDRSPREDQLLLDPGCGTGAFIQGVIRWCDRAGLLLPRIVGIDSDPALLQEAKRRIGPVDRVLLRNEDFLTARPERFDYIVGNPPYVAITGLTLSERDRYRRMYATATGRFDLYSLFFEQALKLLKSGGRLVFVTPEKFLYVQSAERLRERLTEAGVEEIELIDEASFGNLVTYPAITTVSHRVSNPTTRIVLRSGAVRSARLAQNGASWLPIVNGGMSIESAHVLSEAFARISCGVATGADGIYVIRDVERTDSLVRFSFPTLSGRELAVGKGVKTSHHMLLPYARSGSLLAESELGPLGEYLADPDRRSRLMKRTCVSRKPWYAFHENPPLEDILKPKILCKDIGLRPWFVIDELGEIVPRHSVYYLVPNNHEQIRELCAYLNSDEVAEFLMANCQRAANGFVRLQSHVLKQVPLPEHFVASSQLVLA